MGCGVPTITPGSPSRVCSRRAPDGSSASHGACTRGGSGDGNNCPSSRLCETGGQGPSWEGGAICEWRHDGERVASRVSPVVKVHPDGKKRHTGGDV